MGAVMESSVLAELMQRAGASDKDRPAWLAERMGGVTATEIRDLMVKGPTFRRELIEIKLGIRESTFTGNQYTAWGTKREPIIAAWVESRFAIAPESRVFHAADNPRFLCSPDGLGVNFDGELVGSEIKTSGHDIAPKAPKYIEVGYVNQKTWNMRCTGARRWLYVWERHRGDWVARGGEYLEPTPMGEPQSAWIGYDEGLAAELERVAVEFLAELDAARAALEAGDGPVVDEELDTLAVNYLRFLGEEKSGATAKKSAWDELLELLGAKGKDFSQESPLARITYTAAVSGTADALDEIAAVDSSAAAGKRWESLLRARAALAKKEAAWSEFAGKFTRSVPAVKRAGLTVTSVKTKEKSK